MSKLIVAVLGVMVFSASAFAAGDVTSTTGALTIGGGALTSGVASATATIGLSPKVVARYVTDGTSETTAQWYAIATVHPGGNLGYGTAQDVNNIYMKCYTTGAGTDAITGTIPTVAEPKATTDADGVETVAAATWTNLTWSLTTPDCK